MATHFVNGVKLKIVPSPTMSFIDTMITFLLSNNYRSMYRRKDKTNEEISVRLYNKCEEVLIFIL